MSLSSSQERILGSPFLGESHMGNHILLFWWQWACHSSRTEFPSSYSIHVVTAESTVQVQVNPSFPFWLYPSFNVRSCTQWGINPLNLNWRWEPMTKAKWIEFSFLGICTLNEVICEQNSNNSWWSFVATWIEVLVTPVVLVPTLSLLWLEFTTYLWNLYIICHKWPLSLL